MHERREFLFPLFLFFYTEIVPGKDIIRNTDEPERKFFASVSVVDINQQIMAPRPSSSSLFVLAVKRNRPGIKFYLSWKRGNLAFNLFFVFIFSTQNENGRSEHVKWTPSLSFFACNVLNGMLHACRVRGGMLRGCKS